MQPTWYEIGTTAVLGALAAALAVTADRVPRLHRFLPLAVSTAVSLVTIEFFAINAAHGGPVLLMLPALFYFIPPLLRSRLRPLPQVHLVRRRGLRSRRG